MKNKIFKIKTGFILVLFCSTLTTINSQSKEVELGNSISKTKLSLSVTSADININGAAQNNISYTVYDRNGNELKPDDFFQVSKGNNTVVLVQKQGSSMAKSIELRLPKQLMLDINSVKGKTNALNMNANMKVLSESGDITLSNITGSVDTKCESCDIKITNIKGIVFSVNKSGNTEVDIAELAVLDNYEHPAMITNKQGKLTLKLPSQSEVLFKIVGKKGNIQSDFNLMLIKERSYQKNRDVGSGLYGINNSFNQKAMLIIRNYQGQIALKKR